MQQETEALRGRAKSTASTSAASYRALAAVQLRRVAGLDACDPAVIHEWVAAGELAQVPRGRSVGRHDQTDAPLVLVVEGALKLGRDLGKKNAYVAMYLGPGDLQGLLSIVDGMPEMHDMVAHEASRVLLVPRERVRASLEQHTAVRAAFEVQLAYRCRLLFDRLHDTICNPLSYRLARHLCFLGKSFGSPRAAGVEIPIRVSQHDLAVAVGASRQQVNAELNKFVQRGLISLARQSVTILDPEALEGSGYGNMPFTLLRHPEARPAPKRVDAKSRLKRSGDQELAGRHVLVVEDDPVVRMILAAQIQQAGAEVDEAGTGEDAVAMACGAARRYDVILMDEHLPEMSGSAATRRIREFEAAKALSPTPILCVSSAGARGDTRRFIAAGMNAHVVKPIARVELIGAVRALIP